MPTELLLNELPDIETLRRRMQSLAILDAIMSIEWQFRYYSFNSKWDEGEMLASINNGGGDELFILFDKHGAVMKGFDHESEMNVSGESEKVWQGVLNEVPSEFQNFLQEPAFQLEYATFCIWRLNNDTKWNAGKIQYPDKDETADGSSWLLSLLVGSPQDYCDWAKDYYEREIPLEPVKKIYQGEPIAEEIVKALNQKCSLADLAEDIKEIGYPAI